MAWFQSSEFVLERKCLGLLALPLITLNGLMRSANNPLGNALEHFCGYNYQHHTLDKFLRELKYLGISDRLLREQVWFWRQHWQEFESSGLPFLCYYVDGNTKPLWPRKVIEEGRAKRYYYGEATLRECRLELEDSREKGYLVEVRAVRIDWDYGKRTVLITSLPKEVVGASLVVKAYFDRWPSEELQFKRMKSFACLNRVAGYGKKKLPDEKVRATQQQLQRQITALRQNLKVPLKQIADQEEQVAKAIEKELRIRSRAPVVDGQRKLPEAARRKLQVLSREIAASRRQVKVIESQWGMPLRRLRRY